MKLHFTKMQSLGNDFVVFDFTQTLITLSPEQLQKVADRHFGIGCDQILIAEPSSNPKLDFKYRVFNADGSEAGQCGNGSRCFAHYVHDRGLTDSNPVKVEILGGEMSMQLLSSGEVSVNVGIPEFEPKRIPFIADVKKNLYEVEVSNQFINLSVVSLGNPHAVIQVDDVNVAQVNKIGKALQAHSNFPERVNVGFMQVNNTQDIHLRVYERGVGETLACGSGACAAVVCGRQLGLLDANVLVHVNGGALSIEWLGEGQPVIMTGPAQTVYTGTIEI